MFHTVPILMAVALLAGCQSSLPFRHQVIPVIPDSLKVKGAHAKAHAVNDAGHVVGIYSPPAPRHGDQIFVLANGRLIRHEYPCTGFLRAAIITDTGLVAGHCQARKSEDDHSFVFSYQQGGDLQAVQPAWPSKGFLVSGMNNRGDAIGWTYKPFHLREPDEVRGFIHVAGQLHVVRRSASAAIKRFSDAVINEAGLVFGGESDRPPSEFHHFVFQDGKFVALPSEIPGTLAAANTRGHYAIRHRGRSFGIQEAQYRTIDCGKQWCSVDDMNDRGWVAGDRHNTYPVPPLGASSGDTFIWANDKFHSIDKSVGMKVNSEYPLKLSNEGHILFHSDGWPYLLTPESLPAE